MSKIDLIPYWVAEVFKCHHQYNRNTEDAKHIRNMRKIQSDEWIINNETPWDLVEGRSLLFELFDNAYIGKIKQIDLINMYVVLVCEDNNTLDVRLDFDEVMILISKNKIKLSW